MNAIKFFLDKQDSLLSATFVVMLMTLLSRFLGLVKYRLLAHFFGGDLPILDSFIAASLVPDVLFDILIFGTISIAFIPVFSHLLAQKREKDAWELVTALTVSGTLIFFIISVVAFVLAPQIAILIAPGQALTNEGARQTIANLIRIMLVSQLFFVPATILMGVSQTYRYFFVPALAPVLYNLGIIAGIIFLTDKFSIYAPAYGMIFGALLFLLIQLTVIKRVGIKFIIGAYFIRGITRVLSLSLPRVVVLVTTRVNDLLNISLASLVSPGSVVVFNFAQTLQLAPVGIFGASIAQAILPTFSIIYGRKEMKLFKEIFLSTFQQILFIILPLSAILAVLRIPIVRLIYGSSNFPWEATVTTGQVLIIFSFSLFAQVLNLLFSRAFYAMHDTKTPLFVTLFSMVINIGLSLFFIIVKGLGIHFLAVSFSLANIIQGALLFILLSKKLGGIEFNSIFMPILKIVFASGIMAIALYIPMKLLDQLVFDTTRTIPLILLTSIAGLSGLIVYAILSWLFNIGQITPVITFIKRFGKIKKIREEEEAEVVNGRLNS